MSVLSEILLEEYERLLRTISSYESMAGELPKGSIREKSINGRRYAYLQWRDGSKICSKYIKRDEVGNLNELIEKRKRYDRELQTLRASKKEFDKIIGKDI
jgi:hypothetical protein